MFGLACGLVAALARLPFEPVLAGRVPFVFFVPAVAVAAVRGGVVGAIPAALVGACYLGFGTPFLARFQMGWSLAFALYFAAAGVVTALAVELRTALQHLGLQQAQLRQASEAVFQSEALRRAILESSIDYAIISLDPAGRVTSWNEGAVRLLGWAAEEMVGQLPLGFFAPEHIDAGLPEEEMRVARQAGRCEAERVHRRKDGARFWAASVMLPLQSADGENLGFIKILRDRTREHQAEAAQKVVEAKLRLERRTLEAIFKSAPVGLSLSEAPSGRSILINDEMRRIVGREIAGEDLSRYLRFEAVHPDGAPYALGDYPPVRSLRRGEEVRAEPLVIMRPGGSAHRAEMSSTPLRDASGEVTASVTVLVDVEAREQAAEHQRLLIEELAHRMKNTLSMVQAIVSQTLRGASSVDAARTEIMERLAVLSRAQDALTRTSWTSASLAATVDAALEPLSLGPERLAVEGPEVRLGSRAALSFTLALHELATNAVKYGALSSPEGRVRIDWRVDPAEDGPRLRFTWTESGGPEVRTPERQGFGSRLIDSVSRTFAGDSSLQFEADGVRWEVTARTESLQAF